MWHPSVEYRETTSTLETVPHEKLGEGKGVTPSVVTNGANDAHQAAVVLAQHRHALAHTLHIHGKQGTASAVTLHLAVIGCQTR